MQCRIRGFVYLRATLYPLGHVRVIWKRGGRGQSDPASGPIGTGSGGGGAVGRGMCPAQCQNRRGSVGAVNSGGRLAGE